MFKVELFLVSALLLSCIHLPKVRELFAKVGGKRKVIFLLLLLLSIAPIWAFKYFPSSDGPNHLLEAHILREYDNTQYDYPKHFYFTGWFGPNMLFPLFALVLKPVGILTVEKIFLSLMMVLTPLSVYYFLSVFKNTEGKEFITFLFLFSIPLSMGFYNYMIGIPFAFFAIGYYLRSRGYFDLKKIACLLALLYLCFFTHLFSVAFALSAIFLLVLFGEDKRQRKYLLAAAAMAVIAYLLLPPLQELVNSFVKSQSASSAIPDPSPYSLKAYKLYRHLIPYSIIGAFTVFFLLCLFAFLALSNNKYKKNSKFLLAFLVFLAIYMLIPTSMFEGYLDMRLITPMFLFLLPWLRMEKRLQGIFIALVCVITAFLAVEHSLFYSQYNQLIEVFNSGISSIESNKMIYPIVLFNKQKFGSVGADPLNTVASYYLMEKGGLGLFIYASPWITIIQYQNGGFGLGILRPVDSCEKEQQYDYILTWDYDYPSQICGNFRLKYQHEELSIYEKI